MSKARIHYARVDEFWRKEQKYRYLEEMQQRNSVDWQDIHPDEKHTWLTEGLNSDFETFLLIGSKEAKSAKDRAATSIFKTYGRGVATSRDTWAYNFISNNLIQNIQRTIETYNEQVFKWSRREDRNEKVDDFVLYNDHQISWSRDLKVDLQRERFAEFTTEKVRLSLYRPFTKSYLFFDRILNEEVYVFPSIFPTPATEKENQAICVTGPGSEKPFMLLLVNSISDLHLSGPGCSTQCFPFYTYDEDGSNRKENITDWALNEFRSHYEDKSITEWDIFYYVYAVLHHPAYRTRYAANLKRELPRIPFAPDFRAFAEAGKQLAELHVDYEKQTEYPLEMIENPNAPLDWRVEKMRLSKDKTKIVCNEFLTLAGIPAAAFEYRLGNRSALEWVIDQYQVTTDKRSGITNDPNRADDPQYIVRLIGQVITVSLETIDVVRALPDLGVEAEADAATETHNG